MSDALGAPAAAAAGGGGMKGDSLDQKISKKEKEIEELGVELKGWREKIKRLADLAEPTELGSKERVNLAEAEKRETVLITERDKLNEQLKDLKAERAAPATSPPLGAHFQNHASITCSRLTRMF